MLDTLNETPNVQASSKNEIPDCSGAVPLENRITQGYELKLFIPGDTSTVPRIEIHFSDPGLTATFCIGDLTFSNEVECAPLTPIAELATSIFFGLCRALMLIELANNTPSAYIWLQHINYCMLEITEIDKLFDRLVASKNSDNVISKCKTSVISMDGYLKFKSAISDGGDRLRLFRNKHSGHKGLSANTMAKLGINGQPTTYVELHRLAREFLDDSSIKKICGSVMGLMEPINCLLHHSAFIVARPEQDGGPLIVGPERSCDSSSPQLMQLASAFLAEINFKSRP